jgi:hypothetical protein
VVTFAPQPHTTQLFQVLDLTLFGVLKRHGQYQLPFEDHGETSRFVKKMYHDHDSRMTMIEPSVWGVFRGIGVKDWVVNGVQRVSFEAMTLREAKGFMGLSDIDFP